MPRSRGARIIQFRANPAEEVMLDNLAKLFPDSGGNPNVSEAIHFVMNFFIWQSQQYPTEAKLTLTGLYDFWSQFEERRKAPVTPRDSSRR